MLSVSHNVQVINFNIYQRKICGLQCLRCSLPSPKHRALRYGVLVVEGGLGQLILFVDNNMKEIHEIYEMPCFSMQIISSHLFSYLVPQSYNKLS